ncbi:MAG: hypothetical protein IPL57_07060 [Rubrivivax sp.]|nr:hypothetical protein [Rubrivivax sp.]
MVAGLGPSVGNCRRALFRKHTIMAIGRKTGGRAKGTPNRRTAEAKALCERLATEGSTPLDVMLTAMRHAAKEGDFEQAVDFAAKAAPYVHPRLSAIELDLKDVSDAELQAAAR